LPIDNRALRANMIFVMDEFWEASKPRVNGLVDSLKPHLGDIPRDKLLDSFRTLEGIYEGMKDDAYEREEDHIHFKDQAVKMEDIFKPVLQSYLIQRSLQLTAPNGTPMSLSSARIDDMSRALYDDLERRRGLRRGDLKPAYSPLTLLVRFIRNCEEHVAIKPTDHITGKRSFGNIYTLCSLFMLAIYSYTEILQTWVDTESVGNVGSTRTI